MSAAPLMAVARVVAGVTSLTCHERKFLARRAPRHGSQTFLNTRLNRNSSLTAARVVAVLIQLR